MIRAERTGGADRDRVIEVLDAGPLPGAELLTALEKAGYRVIRAGQVPHIDPIDHVVARLDDVLECDFTLIRADARNARNTLEQLTQLATAVLSIDPNDFDVAATAETGA